MSTQPKWNIPKVFENLNVNYFWDFPDFKFSTIVTSEIIGNEEKHRDSCHSIFIMLVSLSTSGYVESDSTLTITGFKELKTLKSS